MTFSRKNRFLSLFLATAMLFCALPFVQFHTSAVDADGATNTQIPAPETETDAETDALLQGLFDAIRFLGVQARKDDYAAMRFRYLVKAEDIEQLEALGADFSFGMLYGESDALTSPDALTVRYDASVGEFTANGDFENVSAYRNGEFSNALHYCDVSEEGIDFGVMLPPVALGDLSDGGIERDYCVRGYLALVYREQPYVFYADFDTPEFGTSISVREASEYFLYNGYADATVPSMMVDGAVRLAVKQAEALFFENDARYRELCTDTYTLANADEGASLSYESFQEVEAAVQTSLTMAKAIPLCMTLANARKLASVCIEQGKQAYENARARAALAKEKLDARDQVIREALIGAGMDEGKTAEETKAISKDLRRKLEEAFSALDALAVAYENLTAIQEAIGASSPENALKEKIAPEASLSLDGAEISAYTIVTKEEHLPAAELLQKYFASNFGACVGIYCDDNPYLSHLAPAFERSVLVGMTEEKLAEEDLFSLYYGSALTLEGRKTDALAAAASSFLHGFCVGKGALEIGASALGERFLNRPYSAMYEINMPTEFPEIKLSSYDVYGVMEAFAQRVSEMPEEATVVPLLTPDRYESSALLSIYVAKDGSDTEGDGSFEKPYATLTRALSDTAYKSGAMICIREGVYSLAESVKINTQHSGTETSPLYITSYQGEKVVLTTAKSFEGSAFVPAEEADFLPENAIARLNTFRENNSKNVYVADLSSLGFDQKKLASIIGEGREPNFYFGDTKYWSARWPNKGAEDAEMKIKGGFVSSMNSEADVKAVGRVTTANSNLYGEYKDAEGPWEMYVDQVTYYSHLLAYDTDALASHLLWMNGSAYAEWDNKQFQLDLLTEEGTGRHYVRAHKNNNYGYKYTADHHLFFYNMLEDLDSVGEYLIDAECMVLYLYAEEAPASDAPMAVSTDSHTAIHISDAENVILNGLHIERCFGYAVNISNTDRVLVQDCLIRNMNNYAILIQNGVQTGVTYSEFYSCNAINITEGRSASLFPTRNFVQNNNFSNAGDSHDMTIGVKAAGVSCVISHNYFHETRLYTERLFESLIEYNEFNRGEQYTMDNGPIYTNGNYSRAVHIRYNYLHDLNFSLYGIYLDDLTTGNYVYGNVVHYAEDAPKNGKCVFLHGAYMCVVTNNICINSTGNAISNSLNYYVKTVDGKAVGGGGRATWVSLLENRLHKNGNFFDDEVRASRFPMLAWYTEKVDRVLSKVKADPAFDPANKTTPQDTEEIFIRTPGFNVYTNNVFYNCAKDLVLPKITLSFPEIGDYSNYINGNAVFAKGEDVGFADEENKNFAIKEDSVLFEMIDGFYAPDMSRVGIIDAE